MIRNLSKNTLLCNKYEEINGVSKIKGLIGLSRPKTIFFKTRFGVHTFFIKFPIDIIVLDKSNRVVVLKKKVRAGSFVFWNLKYENVIEAPNNTINTSNTQVGDKIAFML